MKITLALILILLGYSNTYSQDTKTMSLEDMINRVWHKSNSAKHASENIKYARDRVIQQRTNLYPDVDISGKYAYLNKAKIHVKTPDIKTKPDKNSTSAPIHHLLMGKLDSLFLYFRDLKFEKI